MATSKELLRRHRQWWYIPWYETRQSHLLSPLRDNDNRDLTPEINEVEDECFLLFGAWTLAGHFKGVWRMEGGEQRIDTSAAYMVVLPENQLEELGAVLRRFKAKTTQEAIYLEVEHDVDLRLI